MQKRRINAVTQVPAKTEASVNRIAQLALEKHQTEITKRKITVETDLPETTANVYSHALHAAVSHLIENAIWAMPDGGELSVTLVDSESQWELEIADSADRRNRDAEPKTEVNPDQPTILKMSDAVPIDRSKKIRAAKIAAALHDGQIQTWDCPQGGTAIVLVIPRVIHRRKAA